MAESTKQGSAEAWRRGLRAHTHAPAPPGTFERVTSWLSRWWPSLALIVVVGLIGGVLALWRDDRGGDLGLNLFSEMIGVGVTAVFLVLFDNVRRRKEDAPRLMAAVFDVSVLLRYLDDSLRSSFKGSNHASSVVEVGSALWLASSLPSSDLKATMDAREDEVVEEAGALLDRASSRARDLLIRHDHVLPPAVYRALSELAESDWISGRRYPGAGDLERVMTIDAWMSATLERVPAKERPELRYPPTRLT